MYNQFNDDRNSRWIWWLVGATLMIIVITICAVVGLIIWNSGVLGNDRGETGGGDPSTQPTALVVPTAPATATTAVIAATATLPQQQASAVPSPTPTAFPSATEAVVATATIPAGDSVTAVRVSTPFNIDGNLDGWNDIPVYPSAFRVFTIGDWDGSDDVEAYWRLAWDNDNLYIGVLVNDDRHVQTQTGNQLFRGDSVDMQFDTDRGGDFAAGVNLDDYQITFSPGDFSTIPPSAFRYRGTEQGQMLDYVGHNIIIRAQPASGGYTIEAAIPWIDLGLRPQAGFVMGIALNVNDNDTPNTGRQEVMKSHVSTRTFTNPTTWGTLILAGE